MLHKQGTDALQLHHFKLMLLCGHVFVSQGLSRIWRLPEYDQADCVPSRKRHESVTSDSAMRSRSEYATEKSSPSHGLVILEHCFRDDKARAAHPTEDDLRATLMCKSSQWNFRQVCWDEGQVQSCSTGTRYCSTSRVTMPASTDRLLRLPPEESPRSCG